MHPEGGLGFMDKPCDHRTSDGDTNHRIWQEFHTVLWDSVRFYEILRIMVSYGSLWLRLDFKAGFYEVPLGSVWILFGSAGYYDILLYSFVFFPVPRYALLFFCKADISSRILPIKAFSFAAFSLFAFLSSSDFPSGSIRDNYNKYYVDQSILSSPFFSRKPHREFTG